MPKTYPKPSFSLSAFSLVNEQRNKSVFKDDNKKPTYFGAALCEEAGEVAGNLKKVERGFNDREYVKTNRKYLNSFDSGSHPEDLTYSEAEKLWLKDKQTKLGEELADVFIYLDLIATNHGINVWEHIQKKFNSVSDEMKCPEFKI